jgi:hypothetical protein
VKDIGTESWKMTDEMVLRVDEIEIGVSFLNDRRNNNKYLFLQIIDIKELDTVISLFLIG